MKREYDLRFVGLRALDSQDAENTKRVKRVRSVLLRIAGGFTEIDPGVCTDLIPGEGLGYVVTLPSKKKVRELDSALRQLSRELGLEAPKPCPAAEGPRHGYSFFLVPEKANPAPAGGFRRPLFRQLRWAKIEAALGRVAASRVEFVYGEWLPSRSARTAVQDDSRMYVVKGASASIQRNLAKFIRAEVFDKGIECDQECIYLSSGGIPTFVTER